MMDGAQRDTLVSNMRKKLTQISLLMRWPLRSSESRPVFVASESARTARPGRLNLLCERLSSKSDALLPESVRGKSLCRGQVSKHSLWTAGLLQGEERWASLAEQGTPWRETAPVEEQAEE